jgi:ElaB/YqjD/DUF883 family membrane-anchored ribosome-binding protein
MAKIEQSEIGEKLKEVLDLLKETSSEKKNEILEKLDTFYEGLKEAPSKVAEKTKKAAQVVDKKVHENPWPFIGAAALGGVALGFLIRFSRRAGQQA